MPTSYRAQYTDGFLRGIDAALEPNYRERPQSVAEWRSSLGLGPDRSTTDPHETRHGTPISDSEATIVVVTGIMALLAWLWVERNGGGVIPGQAPSPEQSYQDPVPAPLSQSLESDASATRDKSTPPPGQEPGRYAEVSEPPPAPLTPEQQIAGVIRDFDCTPLQIERLAEGDYAISGHVASQADLRNWMSD